MRSIVGTLAWALSRPFFAASAFIDKVLAFEPWTRKEEA